MFSTEDMISLPQSLAPVPVCLSTSFPASSSLSPKKRKRPRAVSKSGVGSATQSNDGSRISSLDASAEEYSKRSMMQDGLILGHNMEPYVRFVRINKRRVLEAAPQGTSKLSLREHRLFLELQAKRPNHDRAQTFTYQQLSRRVKMERSRWIGAHREYIRKNGWAQQYVHPNANELYFHTVNFHLKYIIPKYWPSANYLHINSRIVHARDIVDLHTNSQNRAVIKRALAHEFNHDALPVLDIINKGDVLEPKRCGINQSARNESMSGDNSILQMATPVSRHAGSPSLLSSDKMHSGPSGPQPNVVMSPAGFADIVRAVTYTYLYNTNENFVRIISGQSGLKRLTKSPLPALVIPCTVRNGTLFLGDSALRHLTVANPRKKNQRYFEHLIQSKLIAACGRKNRSERKSSEGAAKADEVTEPIDWSSCYAFEHWDLGESGIRAVVRSGPYIRLKYSGDIVLARTAPEYYPHVGEETWYSEDALDAWAASTFLPENTSLWNVRVAAQSLRHQQFQASKDVQDGTGVQASSRTYHAVGKYDATPFGSVIGVSKTLSGESLPNNRLKSVDRLIEGSKVTRLCESGGAIQAATSVLSRILKMKLSDGNFVICTNSALPESDETFNISLYQRLSPNAEVEVMASSKSKNSSSSIDGEALVDFNKIMKDCLQFTLDRRQSSISENDVLGSMKDAMSVREAASGFFWRPQRDNVPQISETFPPKNVSRFLRASDMTAQDNVIHDRLIMHRKKKGRGLPHNHLKSVAISEKKV